MKPKPKISIEEQMAPLGGIWENREETTGKGLTIKDGRIRFPEGIYSMKDLDRALYVAIRQVSPKYDIRRFRNEA